MGFACYNVAGSLDGGVRQVAAHEQHGGGGDGVLEVRGGQQAGNDLGVSGAITRCS